MNEGSLQWKRLGESAAILYGVAPEVIRTLQEENPDLEFVPCYNRVGVYFPSELDPARIEAWAKVKPSDGVRTISEITIPICFELGPDIDEVVALTGTSKDDFKARFVAVQYDVSAIGFCPGFPYLSGLDSTLCGVSRLPTPRKRVEPGMVGITGSQAGIYPLVRPGGWRLIGQTPRLLVDVEKTFFLLKWGDKVRFQPITRDEFEEQGVRLNAGMG
jgi:inhibitor of KinA